MLQNSSYRLDIFREAATKQRLNCTTARYLVFGVGVVLAALMVVISIQPGPARDVIHAVAAPSQLNSSRALSVDVGSANSPSRFGYLEFDWTGQLPGFGPINTHPDNTQRPER